MRALIVEQGWSRGGLAAARGLSAAGWQVGIAGPEPGGLAGSSRACERRHRISSLQSSPAAFVDSVATVIRTGGYDVVFGAGEAEVLALSAGRDALPAVFPHASHQVVTRALDKTELSRAAAAVGMAVPEILAEEDIPDESTPVVVKARSHARPDVEGAPARIDTLRVHGRTAAHRRANEIRALGGEPEIQSFHPGRLVAYAAVRSATGVIADSLQHASRIWPPGAGASSRAQTVAADEHLTRRAGALLAELNWVGLAELQFLADAAGVHRLIDLNGRFYGSLSLAIAAGANLPAIWADLAVGRVPPAPVRARAGVRYQWGTGDVRRALQERQGGLLADLFGTAAYGLRARHSVAALDDPGPAVARLLHSTGTAARAGLQSRVRKAVVGKGFSEAGRGDDRS
jgi:predicted ATP-grasp superfamily ATP-dependent carboligase